MRIFAVIGTSIIAGIFILFLLGIITPEKAIELILMQGIPFEVKLITGLGGLGVLIIIAAKVFG